LVIMVPVEVPIVVMIPVPAMVVRGVAVIAIPIAFKEALSIMMRFHPTRAGVGRTGPISLVPLIVAAYRVPVARYPGIIGPGTSWLNPKDTGRRRRADSYSDGNLSEDSSRCQEHQDN
jgi:hypothetical protein